MALSSSLVLVCMRACVLRKTRPQIIYIRIFALRLDAQLYCDPALTLVDFKLTLLSRNEHSAIENMAEVLEAHHAPIYLQIYRQRKQAPV